MSRLPPIRVGYVGPNMDLALGAYRGEHQARGHQIEYYSNPDHLPKAPFPDVVVIGPLQEGNGRIEGPCLVSGFVPPTTLIVAIGTAQGRSHAMWIKHALDGHCHRRILIHYPRPNCHARQIVEQVDRAARQSGDLFRTTGAIPEPLLLNGASMDLGQLMDDPSLTELLFLAATDRDWSTWSQLARKLGLAEGTTKNRMSKVGRLAFDGGLLPSGANESQRFRAADFVRFVTEHRSFIRAYYQHLEPWVEEQK